MPTCSDEGYDRGVKGSYDDNDNGTSLDSLPPQDLKILPCKNHHILDVLDLEPAIAAKLL